MSRKSFSKMDLFEGGYIPKWISKKTYSTPKHRMANFCQSGEATLSKPWYIGGEILLPNTPLTKSRTKTGVSYQIKIVWLNFFLLIFKSRSFLGENLHQKNLGGSEFLRQIFCVTKLRSINRHCWAVQDQNHGADLASDIQYEKNPSNFWKTTKCPKKQVYSSLKLTAFRPLKKKWWLEDEATAFPFKSKSSALFPGAKC